MMEFHRHEGELLSVALEPKTAKAADHPCELYAHDGFPRPTRTQYHHRHPVYLQNRVYGQIRDQSPPDMMWLCGLCHDSVHDWVSFLLGEAREPYPHPGWKARHEAERTVAWFRAQNVDGGVAMARER